MAPVEDMALEAAAAPGESLRSHLRAATMAAHDLLDHAMQAASGWQTRADYARFLALQHAARAPIEAWLAAHAPSGLIPPEQTGLLARDLAALGADVPLSAPLFTIGRCEAGHALGTAWVLAGSALGNTAIVRQVARIGGGAWPVAFLSDNAMMGFWKALRSRIESPANPDEAAGATRAAEAVFAHFLSVAEGERAPQGLAEGLPA